MGLPLRIEEYTLADLPALCELKQEAMFGLAMNVWNRLVHAGVKQVNPQALGPWVRRADSLTFQEIERLIGEPVFHDVLYLRAIIPMEINGEDEVADFFVARVHPNELALQDISIIDPRKPLRPSEQQSDFHVFKGVGLLSAVMANFEAHGRSAGCTKLILTAGTTSNMHLFGRYGFTVESNEFARGCVRAGIGIPMEKAVS